VAATGRILVVCTGNVCRSPFVERALQRELDASWGPGAVSVESAGTGALVGQPVHPPVRVLMEEHGYAADDFTARAVTAPMVADADLVLVAAREHLRPVLALRPAALRRTFTFRELARLVRDLPAGGGGGAGAGGAGAGAGGESDGAVDGAGADAHLRQVAALALGRRGRSHATDHDGDDLVDPYGRKDKVAGQLAEQVLADLPAVAAALGRPSSPSSPGAPA
jgi:protein-tyrosine phosphatase